MLLLLHRVPHRRIAGRASCRSRLLAVVLVAVAVAQRRLGPSSSATPHHERALPSSAVPALAGCVQAKTG